MIDLNELLSKKENNQLEVKMLKEDYRTAFGKLTLPLQTLMEEQFS